MTTETNGNRGRSLWQLKTMFSRILYKSEDYFVEKHLNYTLHMFPDIDEAAWQFFSTLNPVEPHYPIL